MNPVLPLHHFVPDVEARVWKDGRIYLYGSYDISRNLDYCSHEYHVFSSDDLENWTDHGVSFCSRGEKSGVPWSNKPLYAPDCVFKDGLYYLYFCLSDGTEGVAVSQSPYGPFGNASQVEGTNGTGIDPAVLIDDDGQSYYFWGQYRLSIARMNPDMRSLDASSIRVGILNEEEHGFHEGASIRKRNGIYYLLYTDISRGRATCISYATSSSPFGPYKKGGIIIDNSGCDPWTWNNHGSIVEFKGKWYIMYHRSTQGSRFNRRVCMEPISFLEGGHIPEVEMSTQGSSDPISACNIILASRACKLFGNVRIEYMTADNIHKDDNEILSCIENGDMVAYKEIDFGAGVNKFIVAAASDTLGGAMEIRLDSIDGPLAGICSISNTKGWYCFQMFCCEVGECIGVHSVYLLFKGHYGRLFNISHFAFDINQGVP